MNPHNQLPFLLSPPPSDPLHEFIDSDRYIASLEKKLEKIKSQRQKEPNSRDIIDSICEAKSSHMTEYLQSEYNDTTDNYIQYGSNVESTYVQKILFPERQAISTDELIAFANNDHLSETYSRDEGDHRETGSSQQNGEK